MTLTIYSYIIIALVIFPILMLGLSTPVAGYAVGMVAIMLAIIIPITLLFFPKFYNIWFGDGRVDSDSTSGTSRSHSAAGKSVN